MSTPIVRRRKKPVEVDTIQWTGSNEADVQAFTTFTAPDGSYVLSSNFYALDDEDRENSDDPEATATVYDKLHSTWILVYTGQHIVRGVKGELYPIAEDVLAETYELADAEPDMPTCTHCGNQTGPWKPTGGRYPSGAQVLECAGGCGVTEAGDL